MKDNDISKLEDLNRLRSAPKLSKDIIIIVNSCGDAKKDRDILRKILGQKI